MLNRLSRAVSVEDQVGVRELVWALGGLMIFAQAAQRAWALYPSWFYTDDYRLLDDAQRSQLDLDYLTTPFDNQFMPWGRAVAWLVADSGEGNWALAASLTLGCQIVASIACLWMLTTVFGTRRAILAPLAVYLTSALMMPATMWWAASLNQLPFQVVFFASVASWISYLRTRSPRWLAATLLLLALGLLTYVKTAFIFGVLAFLVLAYFSTGRSWARVGHAVRSYWPSAVSAGALGVTFAVYYATAVPSIFQDGDRQLAGELADTLLSTSLTTGLVGGPWHWDTSNPPTGYADPPATLIGAAAVALTLLVVALALVRVRTGRAWALLGIYSAAAYVVVLTSRAPVAGASIGLELRYLTDVLPVAVLCLGLAWMPMVGSPEGSEPREEPLLRARLRPSWVVALVAVVCLSGAWSSLSYARIWHHDNPGADYTHHAVDALSGRGRVDLADQVVPPEVIPGFSAPYNTTARLLPLLLDNVRFPAVTDNLAVLDQAGRPRRAAIDPVTTGLPGPQAGCGWNITDSLVTIPLASPTFDFTWWVRIAYLSSADSTVTLLIGSETIVAPVRRGLHDLYVRVTDELHRVALGGMPPDETICVDAVEVGNVIPGGEL